MADLSESNTVSSSTAPFGPYDQENVSLYICTGALLRSLTSIPDGKIALSCGNPCFGLSTQSKHS